MILYVTVFIVKYLIDKMHLLHFTKECLNENEISATQNVGNIPVPIANN